MKWTLGFAIGLLAIGATPFKAIAGEVVLSAPARSALEKSVQEKRSLLSVDSALTEQHRQILRTWASGSIDFNKATQRKQIRFNRVSYTQNVMVDVLRIPTEKLQFIEPIGPKALPIAPKLQLDRAERINLKQPMLILYREGPNYYKFQKLKEEGPQQLLANTAAIQLARNFLSSNRILQETQSDRIGEVVVRQRRINEDGESASSQGRDYLVQQDVVFQRLYQGKPVINSKVVVGLQPNSRDIVLLNHMNWAPVKATLRPMVTPSIGTAPSLSVTLPTVSVASLQQRLEAKVRKVSGNFTKAEVNEVFPAWFQTANGLVPIVVFNMEIEYPSPIDPLRRPYVEAINLVGSDDIFYPEHQTVSTPTKAQ
ncbi:MAG: hypothetical protein B0A82_19175 [Alkalinema sp. CACIAM 70d]|nr:MAG: hypothetical protein B0A82_19175 [Alkalinema sp. CACIAM 70d]